MKFKKTYILFFALFSMTVVAQDAVKLTAAVSKNKLGIHQKVKVEFTINKHGADNFELPELKNFEVVAGPSSSISQSWINGKASYKQSYIYILRPKRIGVFKIPSASIEYRGKRIRSNEVNMTILSEDEVPRDPNDPYYIASENVHLVAEVSKEKPYVGEGIYVVYKLYFNRRRVGFSDWRINEVPTYNGFWNQDIEVKQQDLKSGTYKGEKYEYIILKRALLIPQKSGELFIDPISMDISINIPTGKGDFFGNAITRRVNYSTSSSKRVVKVKGLPFENKPSNFNGAVGEFEFMISATKDILRANETTEVNLKLSGKGNLKLFELPEIKTPKELEVYTPERSERINTTLTGLSGKISDTYTIVPGFKGKYKIPEVSFSYFSLKEKAYKTITTAPLIIDVTEGRTFAGNSSNLNAVDATVKQMVVETDNNFRYIQHKTSFDASENKIFFKSTLFYTLLFLPFLAIPFGIFIGNKKAKRDGDIAGNKLRRANKLARKYLSQAKKNLGKNEAFYISLEKALHNYLKATLHIESSDISKEKISEILQGRNVNDETINDFMSVLSDCDFARYTPTTDTMMLEEYEKAKVVIAKIDKQI